MGKWVHRLSKLNIGSKDAVCAACGPVVVVQGDGIWRCPVARKQGRPSRPRNKAGQLRAVGRAWREAIGTCAICLRSLPGEALVVDHCHVTKKIRGVLCYRCNTGLGLFADDPAILTNAVTYLNK